MKVLIYKLVIGLCNSRIFIKIMEKFTNSRASKIFVGLFAEIVGADMSNSVKFISEFSSLNDFFTRKIDMTSRPFADGEDIITSPCDGKISEVGELKSEMLFSIKSKPYSVSDLIPNFQQTDASYMLIYLSPSNYHRFHSIGDCELADNSFYGFKSEPVNDWGLRYGDKPIVKNYRCVSEFFHGKKRFYVVYIGALNVNSIVVYDAGSYSKGDETGYFQFGSSIMIIMPKDCGSFDDIKCPQEIKLGEKIGTWNLK